MAHTHITLRQGGACHRWRARDRQGDREKIDEMTEASWNDMIQVNLSSVFLMTQAVLPGMRARKWGRVINLTSVAAQMGSMTAVHYAAAKAGVGGDVAVLLAGNAYITGQTIGVNGGMYLGS